jgi:hypothetical protein
MVHVAIGFVDLGLLLVANLAAPPPGRSGPLKFIGVERSAYSVAKFRVIWQLARSPPPSLSADEHARALAQIWFSAAWSELTARAFRAAVDLVRAQSCDSDEVAAILDHWAGSPGVCLRAARDGWMARTTDTRSSVAHCARRRDRVALAKYELTGSFATGGVDETGSVVWWDCPDGTPPSADDETVFSTLMLVDVLGPPACGGGPVPTADIVAVAEALVLSRIQKVRSRRPLRGGRTPLPHRAGMRPPPLHRSMC